MPKHAEELLRQWRQRSRLSQLDLAIAADVSSRHVSFVETGRSRPTSEMILRLAEHLDVPLRDRNALLLAGGYAPAYLERGLAEPELQAVRSALKRVLRGHEPYPAPPANVLRLSLHPDGMAPRIANLPEWRAHLLTRLHHQAEATGDARLAELHEELAAYPGGQGPPPAPADVAVPLRYRSAGNGQGQELTFLSITAVVGTPLDVTVSELAIESFYPADAPPARPATRSGTWPACRGPGPPGALRGAVDEAGRLHP
jgi:transcriptional regulator with XRE-family HTH domain